MSNQHADKRSVSTDALETLGMIIGPNEKRDAIHLAVDPAIAVEVLQPGQDVGFVEGGVGVCNDPVGIVDPFLTNPVMPGERFWLVVYPRKITSLRHVWSHPSFKDEPEIQSASGSTSEDRIEFIKELDGTNVSRRWIENFADRVGLTYDELMRAADDWIRSQENGSWGEYLNRGPLLDGEYVPDEFWPHYQKVTGKQIAHEYRGNFFTCSC